MSKARVGCLLLWLVLLVGSASAWERMDEIIAVVGSKPILASELEMQTQLYAVQAGINPKNEAQFSELRQELLRQMIHDRLILIKAKQDTSIKVSDDEVDAAFEMRLEELRNRFAGEEELKRQLAVEGLSFRELKVRLREEVSEQIYKEKLISKLLSRVSVSRADVEQFFDQYADSLPNHPRSVKLAHLVLSVSSAKTEQDSLRQFAEELVSRIGAGESFEELAREFSDDVSAEEGGDIGTFRKGDLLPRFERAALALSSGEVSGVVQTEVGLHIIKLVDKTENTLHCKHILLRDQPTAADSNRVFSRATDLARELRQGEDWGMIVKAHSDDETTRAIEGELGWFAVDNLPAVYQQAVENLDQEEISEPIWTDAGVEILKLKDRQEARKLSIEQDYGVLKEYARRQKSEEVIASVVDEMKDKVHLELRSQ
jgi:peptidyl-prolyl cis-trans isomerase SurA